MRDSRSCATPHLRRVTPRFGRLAGFACYRAGFTTGAAAGPAAGTPSAVIAWLLWIFTRRPRAMTRVWTGRVAATPRARGHPTIDSIRVWLFILPFTTPFDRLLTSPPPSPSPNSRPKRPSKPRRSWARSKSRTAPFPSGSACAPVTPSGTTPSAVTGAAPSSASNWFFGCCAFGEARDCAPG